MRRGQSENEVLTAIREDLDAQLGRLLESVRAQRKQLFDSIKVRKPGRSARLARLRQDERLEITEGALMRIHERVWSADEDGLALIREALLVPYALLTPAERD